MAKTDATIVITMHGPTLSSTAFSTAAAMVGPSASPSAWLLVAALTAAVVCACSSDLMQSSRESKEERLGRADSCRIHQGGRGVQSVRRSVLRGQAGQQGSAEGCVTHVGSEGEAGCRGCKGGEVTDRWPGCAHTTLEMRVHLLDNIICVHACLCWDVHSGWCRQAAQRSAVCRQLLRSTATSFSTAWPWPWRHLHHSEQCMICATLTPRECNYNARV